MKAFDYLSSLLLLFTAITLGELTMGLAYALNAGTKATFYHPHTLFVTATFLGSVDYAMRVYSFRKVAQWQYWSLVLVLVPGLVWLLGTKLLFPDIDPPISYDFEVIFNSNKSLIYAMLSLHLITVNLAFAVIYQIKYIARLTMHAIFLVLLIIGIIIDQIWLDYTLAVLAICSIVLNSFWNKTKIKNER
ncbi:MAG: hypothetical protein JXR10_08770 [Cyclobacteriaceae bacterium]